MNGNWKMQLADWQTWLDEHGNDPALVAACHRLGRRLSEAVK